MTYIMVNTRDKMTRDDKLGNYFNTLQLFRTMFILELALSLFTCALVDISLLTSSFSSAIFCLLADLPSQSLTIPIYQIGVS